MNEKMKRRLELAEQDIQDAITMIRKSLDDIKYDEQKRRLLDIFEHAYNLKCELSRFELGLNK